jgi:hypothetical protein
VDDRRRAEFKSLLESKATADDITYAEVKTVLDKSYEDEDRLVGNVLPPEKAEEYQKTTQPVRQMVYFGASSAFPKPATGEGR